MEKSTPAGQKCLTPPPNECIVATALSNEA